MNNQLRVIISAICFLATMSSASAEWTKTLGLEGYLTKSFAVGGAQMFVGTELNGVFRSTDNGITWNQMNDGLTTVGIYSLAIIGQQIFAGVYGTGVFQSINNGTNWSKIDTGLTYPTINALFADGSNLFVGLNNGIYLSTNSGTAWTWELSHFPGFPISPCVVSFAAIGTSIFAGTFGDGVFLLSTDHKWNAVNNGLTYKYVNMICANGANLFAGTDAGVFLTTNKGNSWNAVDSGLTDTHVRALLCHGSNLFAGTLDGVFLSTNNGTSWTPVNTGLSGVSINCLAVYNSVLYAGVDDGVWQRPLSEITGLSESHTTTSSTYTLEQNYPNPFNPSTHIQFVLDSKMFVSLTVYDVLGSKVATLVSKELSAGKHIIQWNAANMPGNVYFYRLQAGTFSQTKKLILLK